MTDIRVAAEQARVALKPCPFCGSTAELIDRPHGPLLVGAFVQCPECAAAQPIVKTAEEAIEAWNHRASLEAALAALPGDKGQTEAVAKAIYDQWQHEDRWVPWVEGGNSHNQDAARSIAGKALSHAAATPTQQVPQIAGRDGASDAPAQASSYAALTSPGVPSASPLPSLPESGDSALPREPSHDPEHLMRWCQALIAALKRLSFAAQTTGGTAGPDAELMDAISQATKAMSMGACMAAATVREFTNELNNRIKITIEGPASTSENILTPREMKELTASLVAHSSQAQGELSVNPVVTNNDRMNEENQNG